jgi:oligosaccharide repeat unit polymerase
MRRWLKFNKDFFNPLIIPILLYIYITIGFLNFYDLNIHQITLQQSSYQKAYFITIIGIIAYILGYKLSVKKIKSKTISKLLSVRKENILTSFKITVATVTSIGLLFALPTYFKLGMPILNTEYMSLERKLFVWNLSPFVYYQWYFLEFGVLLASIAYFISKSFFQKVYFLFFIILNLLMILPVASRVTLAEAIFYIILARNYIKRNISLRFLIVITLFLIALVSGLWYVRVYGLSILLESDILDLLMKGFSVFCRTSFEAFSYFVEMGIQLYGSITFMSFIQLLPGKQQYVGLYLVSELLGKNSLIVGGTTVSLVGGIFIDFGLFGVVFLMFILGYILTYVYLYFKFLNSIFFMGLYFILLYYYIAMIYGGQFLDVSLFWKLLIWLSLYGLLIKMEKLNLLLKTTSVFLVIFGLIMGLYNLFKVLLT